MDEYKEQGDYTEIPVPSGDGWHRPNDETAGAVPQGGAQQSGWQPQGSGQPVGGPYPSNSGQPGREPYPSSSGQPGGSTPPAGSWVCSCGTVNTGNFCTQCGKPAPRLGGQQPNGSPYPSGGIQPQNDYRPVPSGQPQNYRNQSGEQPQTGWQPGGPSQNGWQQNSQQGPYQQNPYQQPPYQQAPPKENNPLALASMITGLLALITCCCSPLVQFPLAVTSIVLMILSKRGKPLQGYAIAGLIMSIFAILISILMTIMIGLVRSPQYQDFLNSPEFEEIFDEYESLYESFYDEQNDSINGGQRR